GRRAHPGAVGRGGESRVPRPAADLELPRSGRGGGVRPRGLLLRLRLDAHFACGAEPAERQLRRLHPRAGRRRPDRLAEQPAHPGEPAVTATNTAPTTATAPPTGAPRPAARRGPTLVGGRGGF